MTEQIFIAKFYDIENYISKIKCAKEFVYLQTLDHPNIIKIKETYDHEGRVFVYEDHKGGTLEDMIYQNGQQKENIISYKMACAIVYQILKALRHMRKHQIIHRDLCPK